MRAAPLFAQLELIDDPTPRGATVNMAIDEVLLRAAVRPILRVYRWERPAISLGYFTKFSEVEPYAGERELVRRWTGGGVVFHGEDRTFSLLVPRGEALAQVNAAESYRRIHAALAQALGAGELASAAAPKVSAACFENPAESDVLLGGRKIAGGAQRRTAFGLLHQGSVQHAGMGPEFGERLAGAMSVSALARAFSEAELADAGELVETKYGTAEWLRRY